jgi:ABC-type multidrug transport system fused ATPase/permease subunit
MLFSIHSGIAVLGLSVSLVLPWLSMRFMRYNYSAFYENQNSLARLNSFVQETLGGISLIRSYGQEKHFQQQFEQRSTEFRSRNKIIARQSSLIWPVINLVSGFGVVAALAYGVHLVQNEQMTIGELSAALLYLIKLQFPLVGMGWGLYIVQQGRASLNRILELTEKMHTHTSGPVVSLHNPSVQKLEWKNLDFHYPEKKELILKDISFSLEPGKVLGICGETASGKSTLARVLSGIYSPPENAFYINDTDMSLQAASQRMSFFAFAPQESFLFSTSIRENIAMGIRNSHSLSIEEASRLAGLEQDLAQLENGLDTILGEKGVNLSGGQKQRVGLARALITQAPVLILDDVLSAVDNETEKKIIANLRSHLDKNTALIISHRYSALELCHEILYMSEGKIIERGSHQELLALNGFYAHNYRIQSLQEKEYD